MVHEDENKENENNNGKVVGVLELSIERNVLKQKRVADKLRVIRNLDKLGRKQRKK